MGGVSDIDEGDSGCVRWSTRKKVLVGVIAVAVVVGLGIGCWCVGVGANVPAAQKQAAEQQGRSVTGDEEAAKVELDLEDEEAVEAAIEALPEEQREAARQQYQEKIEQGRQTALGGDVGGGAATNSGDESANGSSGGGNGSSTSGDNAGGTAEPEPPAHVHSFDIPIVERQWQDGEGCQRIPRFYINSGGNLVGPFYSEAEAWAWADQNYAEGGPGGSLVDDSYDTWTKEPGYYDVVVGYKCACGAVS